MNPMPSHSFYRKVEKLVAKEKHLKRHRFPLPHPDGPEGRVKIYNQCRNNLLWKPKVPNLRICARCNTAYMADREGYTTRSDLCLYHWGRPIVKSLKAKFTCCRQFEPAVGCVTTRGHVWRYVDYDRLYGFVKTAPKANDRGIYAIDTEVCYTTQGLDVNKVTVVDQNCQIIYETFIRPPNPVIDYNTFFSGITELNLRGETTELEYVQSVLLNLFSEDTIIVGHNLDCDFQVLKLIHTKVVDFNIAFPNQLRFPSKRLLTNLPSNSPHRVSDEHGTHDSSKDAIDCMDYLKCRVMQ